MRGCPVDSEYSDALGEGRVTQKVPVLRLRLALRRQPIMLQQQTPEGQAIEEDEKILRQTLRDTFFMEKRLNQVQAVAQRLRRTLLMYLQVAQAESFPDPMIQL
jgi:hypothetical protein